MPRLTPADCAQLLDSKPDELAVLLLRRLPGAHAASVQELAHQVQAFRARAQAMVPQPSDEEQHLGLMALLVTAGSLGQALLADGGAP